MNKQLFKHRLQKGLSLIEASMVLVLSAVVVAGVMVYYQTAQTNNQLDKTSAQIMHIVSEINGLYAGAKDSGGGIYVGLSPETLVNAIPDLEATATGTIKTPFPGVELYIQDLNYNPATNQPDGNMPANYYTLGLLQQTGTDVIKVCQKFAALNYGGQAQAFVFQDNGQEKYIDASVPLSDKLKQCQNMTSTAGNMFGIVFK